MKGHYWKHWGKLRDKKFTYYFYQANHPHHTWTGGRKNDWGSHVSHWMSWVVRQVCFHSWVFPTRYRADCRPDQPSERHSSCPSLVLREVASPVNYPQQKAFGGLPLRSGEAPQMDWCKLVCWRAECAGWKQAICHRQFQAVWKRYYFICQSN